MATQVFSASEEEQRRRIAELESQLEAARDDVARMEEQVANYRLVGTMPMGEAIDIIINADFGRKES